MSLSQPWQMGKAIARKILRRGRPPRPEPIADGSPFGAAEIQFVSSKPVLPDIDPFAFYNPTKTVQERFVGSSFEYTYREAADFLNHIFARMEPPLDLEHLEGYRALDLGCGWGRMLRVFRSKAELGKMELYGCDTQTMPLELCRRTLPEVWLSHVNTYPPSDYRDNLFDLVYAYSVFTHLSRDSHMAWAKELARIVKPKGYVCITIQPRSFIKVCQEYASGVRQIVTVYHTHLAQSFGDASSEARYDAGEFLYSSTGGAGEDPANYGEAVVPRPFFEDQWGGLGFRIVDWFEYPQELCQSRVLFQKS